MCKIFYESCENLPCEVTSRFSKNFSEGQIKNPFLTKVAQCSGDEKDIYNMIIGPIFASRIAKK